MQIALNGHLPVMHEVLPGPVVVCPGLHAEQAGEGLLALPPAEKKPWPHGRQELPPVPGRQILTAGKAQA